MTVDDVLYIGFLAALYFYPQRMGSVGFIWLSIFVGLNWLVTEGLDINGVIASVAIGCSLLLTFEISRRFWEEPFSQANVHQFMRWVLEKIKYLLHLVGIKPKTQLIDYKDNEDSIEIARLMKEKKWNEAEAALRQMPDDHRYSVIESVTATESWSDVYDEWLENSSGSALAHIVSGFHYIAWAWEARGSSTADTVTNKGIQHFFHRLMRAKEHFERATQLENAFPEAYVGLITIAMGTGFERDRLGDYFVKALVLNRGHWEVHAKMVHALAEKWGGEPGEMFSLAYKASFNAPDDSALPGIVAVAHVEQWLYLAMCDLEDEHNQYFYKKDVLDDLLAAYKKMENISSYDHSHIQAMNMFAFCFYMGNQMSLAKATIKKLEGRFVNAPWYYYEKPFMALFDTGYTLDQVVSEINSAPNIQ